ncbi:MAG: DUF2225 domain-containing protein [Fibrobacteria bacterium]|nr:DUF2225 domain-containing protein [Fibrobacteria bacterium]
MIMAIIDEVGVRRRLRVMLGSDPLVEEYIVRYGYRIDVQKIQILRAEQEKPKPEPVVEVGPEETAADDPVFAIYLKCPSCYQTNIISHDLKSKSLQVLVDRFGMPHYRKAGRFQQIDFNLLSVTVCPQCLFASPDKRDFIARDPARAKELPARLHQGELAAILAAADERAAYLSSEGIDVQRDLVIRDRTPRSAIAAYELAIMRSAIEFSRNVPFSAFKLGGYALKQATIAWTHEIDPTPWYKKAMEHYLLCFERSNAPGFQYDGQILYLIIALSLRLNKIDVGGTYVGVLERTKVRVESANIDAQVLQTFDRWYGMARELWADRENPDLFQLPRP